MRIPLIGFGTYELTGDLCFDAVTTALRVGYRHIDTAATYRNEESMARAIEASGIPRCEIYLVSKLSPRDAKSTESAYEAALKSLERLQTDYLDLYLIHWPACAGISNQSPEQKMHRLQCWRALERLHSEGKAKAIGVSNFLERHLSDLLPDCHIAPTVNQIEFHPLLVDRDLNSFCTSNGIQIEAYSPLAQADPALLEHPDIVSIAKVHGKTKAQVVLRWIVQQNIVVLPRSSKPERIKENFEIMDFELSSEEMEQIGNIHQKTYKRICWDPHTVA